MSGTAKGLLAVWLDASPEREEELVRWYETEHLRDRLAVPGFLSARRYVSLQGEPKHIALYELTSPAVLQGEAYRRAAADPTPLTLRVLAGLRARLRNEYELLSDAAKSQEPAPYAFFVRLQTDSPANDAELVRWYEGDHMPALTGLDGVRRTRLYRATAGAPRFLAIYEVESPQVQGSPEWRAATDTAWAARVRPLFRNRVNNLARLETALP